MNWINKYFLINRLFGSIISPYLPGYFRKKLLKELNINFIPTSLKWLPTNNYSVFTKFEEQEVVIKNFKKNNKSSTFASYPDLIDLLKNIYNSNDSFNFLDFGGEQIDQFLNLKKNFKNINYFVINLPQINDVFTKIKEKYNLKDLNIIYNINYIDKNKYDFVNFGSVLQYIYNYENLLDKILNVSKKYVLISGTHFYNLNAKKFFVVRQVNYWHYRLYLYFFNLDSIFQKFNFYGFNIIKKKKNLTMHINYENFQSNSLNDLEYTDILFKK